MRLLFYHLHTVAEPEDIREHVVWALEIITRAFSECSEKDLLAAGLLLPGQTLKVTVRFLVCIIL